MKKWTNILNKYKPQINYKILFAKKTRGGPAEAELSELELKIQIFKAKEIFEGITAEIDTSIESPVSPVQWKPLNVGTSVQHVSSTLSGCPDYSKF